MLFLQLNLSCSLSSPPHHHHITINSIHKTQHKNNVMIISSSSASPPYIPPPWSPHKILNNIHSTFNVITSAHSSQRKSRFNTLYIASQRSSVTIPYKKYTRIQFAKLCNNPCLLATLHGHLMRRWLAWTYDVLLATMILNLIILELDCWIIYSTTPLPS